MRLSIFILKQKSELTFVPQRLLLSMYFLEYITDWFAFIDFVTSTLTYLHSWIDSFALLYNQLSCICCCALALILFEFYICYFIILIDGFNRFLISSFSFQLSMVLKTFNQHQKLTVKLPEKDVISIITWFLAQRSS